MVNCSAVISILYDNAISEQSDQVQYFLATTLVYNTDLSVKKFPGRYSTTSWGAAPSNLYDGTLSFGLPEINPPALIFYCY